MNAGEIFENVTLSALYGVVIFLLSARDLETDLALVAGLLAFVVVLATLWLIVERELDPQTGVIVKGIMWGAGLSLLLLFACIALAGFLA